ncbi:MAG TPA: class I SAM-dependent methyltransferase [Bacillus bacterium]|uniref:Methyltransferase n=1 Tax=Siminovitchia fordii TaxID=254759 RepID=A0ABQ4K4W0_9BACI|nr:class I SAM-dependent methyltransferase [Siminovitchia fordii]GIN20060.1 methyltransferase [Siminovitchia fordii]HBZ09082.1 class I SAM-dependent methyltransferase [Bacillus sp. (in: firmicutes)]
MSYEQLAYVYDHLMADAPYDDWLRYLTKVTESYQAPGNRVLDLGCGTGELSIRLLKQGFDVTGVDVSEDMLAVSAEKADKEGVALPLFQQDMSKLEGLPEFDIATVFCDSLNYLSTPEEVQNTFRHVHRHLAPNGLFLFDVHSTYQMESVFLNQTFTWNEEEVAYIWSSFPGEEPHSIEHDLTFFLLDGESGQYERVEEFHQQRTYPVHDFVDWLHEAGFDVLSVTADFSDNPPGETSRRIFFTCRKK